MMQRPTISSFSTRTLPRTPLMRLLARAFRLVMNNRMHTKQQYAAPPLTEQIEQAQANYISRRRFIQQATMAAAALSIAPFWSACARRQRHPLNNSRKIAIVGGGMAGLNAAYTLKKNGWHSEVFEAAKRTGGRMYTAKDIMAQGLTTELGGEFIDSSHEDMFALAKEFELDWLDMYAPSELSLHREAFFFNQQSYTLAQVIEAFADIVPMLEADVSALPDWISYNSFDNRIAALDRLSISQYLEKIGAKGLIKSLLEVAYVTEFGLEADQQSAINLLYLISTDTSAGKFDVFGDSDERYKVKGGNEQIVARIAGRLEGQIYREHKLVAIKKANSSGYQLVFDQNSGKTLEYNADFVIMTLPFTLLREVDLSKASFSPIKMRAIEQLSYGKNAKLMLGFDNRPWRELGYAGYLFTDNGLQTGWDNSQLQGGSAGGYTIYSGGDQAISVGSGTEQEQAEGYLPRLNQVFAGSTQHFSGRVARFHWPSFMWSKGSYACYTTGQWTSIAGAEIEPQGAMFFAGEHCSFDFQGYMNGAAETGRKAAENVLAALK